MRDMEINPYESRLRMLQQFDGVQMQREAAPDEETAGCPGCPYFWTCPIPHKGEEVRAPQEIELEDVQHELGPRRAYRPRDESDIGWLDDDDETEPDTGPEPETENEPALGTGPENEPELGAGPVPATEPGSEVPSALGDDRGGAGEDEQVTRPRGRWNPFRRRR